MLIVLWVLRKWSILRERKRLWLAIWGGIGLAKTAATGFLMIRNGYYDAGPLFGPHHWTQYLFRVTSGPESLRTAWLLEMLVAAITEATIACGLAALSWRLFQRLSGKGLSHRGLVTGERFAICFLLSICSFGVANDLNLWRRETCSDCFFPYTLPFTFFHLGGFAGGEWFVWRGLGGDVLLMFAAGFALGWARTSISTRKASAPATP
jgi:hypothetical protein